MLYQVIYKDENGNPLLESTFNAGGPREALQIMLHTESLAPPEGTASIDVRKIE